MMRTDEPLWLLDEGEPDAVALRCGDDSLTYGQLREAVADRARQLGDLAGRALAFRSSQTADFVVEYLAIHAAGGVAVPLDADCPEATFSEVGERLLRSTWPADTADILFTTGTTGRPKGVVIGHRAIRANTANLIDAQGYSPRLTMIVHGPLNHIGSLSKLQTALACGATVAIMDGLRDVARFFTLIREAPWRAATFLVPAQIAMLLRFASDELAACAPRIDFIETGAAAIAHADMQALCRLLPQTRLYNTYASTETGIIATHDYQHDGCWEGCLGRPMKHSQLVISPDGRIVCRGLTLMSGYLDDPELTRSVLCGDGLHTADLGRLDAEGRLFFVGREGDTINVGGFKVSPVEVESALLAHPEVADCLCIGVPHAVMGHALKMLYVSVTGSPLPPRALAQWLRQRLEAYKVPALYENVPAIRRTFNGKPDRKAYAQR